MLLAQAQPLKKLLPKAQKLLKLVPKLPLKALKLLLLVPVVGITYEFNRMVGAHDNALTRVLSAPGMWLQNFTTHEPDDSMIEVAIEAMKLVIPEEKGTDTW